MTLKNTIEALAATFAEGVLKAIRSANLSEILAESEGARRAPPAARAPAPAAAPKRGGGGRLARRSPEQISTAIERIVGALKKSKSGMRSEQLQKALDLDKKEIARPLTEALAAKKIRKTGQKRSTTYFAK